ncbi:MAG: hypothetical protein U0840_20080 [Gemmataceae bacterium]
MAKSKVDAKQLLLQHGERIGIAVAGLLAVLLISMSLFMPNRGFFSGSPVAKAKEVDDITNQVNQRLNDPNNLPTDADKPPPDSNSKLVALNRDAVTSEGYRVAALVPSDIGGDLGRRVPRVFTVDEAVAQFRHMRIQSYIFDDRGRIYALRGEGGASSARGGGAGRPGGGLPGMFGPGGIGAGGIGAMFGGAGGAGGAGGGAGRPGGGGNGTMGIPGMSPRGEDEKKDRQVVPVPLNELEKRSDITLAEQVRPLRMVVIAGAFPLKQQVEEFRSKLGLRSNYDVLSEVGADAAAGQHPAFRFLGVRVQRRELDGDGKPIGEFKDLDLNTSYKPYIVLTGRRFEPDEPEMIPVIYPGLVMPRLMQFREENVASAGGASGGAMPPGGAEAGAGTPAFQPGTGAPPGRGGNAGAATAKKDASEDLYPKLEKDLEGIRKTLEAIKGKMPNQVAGPPERFRGGEDLDIFSSSSAAATQTGGMAGGTATGAPGAAMMTPNKPPAGRGAPGAPMGEAGMVPGGGALGQDQEMPEHCLVRLIDVTVQPGKTYEYRLQIRMANPNFGRRDVASPTYAQEKELTSEWSKVPIRAHVDDEMHYYAVDQKEYELDGNPRARYTGPYANNILLHGRQIFLQAHRWIESVTLAGGNPLLFGEWTLAERIPIFRGEYIGRRERVEVPVWRYSREEFTIASDSTTAKRTPGIGVYFGYEADERGTREGILVDFSSGKHGHERVVSRNDDKVETRKVFDDCGQEVLIFKPDGRLMLLEGARDFDDKERVERFKLVKKRIRDVKDKNKPAGPGGAGPNPFGGTNN